jgi:aldehyde dehydrogenase (NAD+)
LSGLHLAECFSEVDLPPGVLNVVLGSGATVGPALVTHENVCAVSLTGSVGVGGEVLELATRHRKRVQLEMGGHNPVIVMADADLGKAVDATFKGAYWSAGQKCTATRRIYVQKPLYQDFRQALLDRMATAAIGDPRDPDTEVGPLVNASQFEEVMRAVERGREEGGEVISGGERADPEAYLLAPTLFEGVTDESMLSREEVFGPVASLYDFGDLDEAIARANSVEFGLAASIFTSSLGHAERFIGSIEAGLVHVNSQTPGAEIHAPFGGIKASGWGPREMGRAAMDFFTENLTVFQDV